MTNFHDVLILGQDALQGEQHGVPGLVVPEEVEVLLEGAEEAGPGGGEEVGPGHHLPGEQVALRVEGRGDQQGPPWEDESGSVVRADGQGRGEDVISWAPLGKVQPLTCGVGVEEAGGEQVEHHRPLGRAAGRRHQALHHRQGREHAGAAGDHLVHVELEPPGGPHHRGHGAGAHHRLHHARPRLGWAVSTGRLSASSRRLTSLKASPPMEASTSSWSRMATPLPPSPTTSTRRCRKKVPCGVHPSSPVFPLRALTMARSAGAVVARSPSPA